MSPGPAASADLIKPYFFKSFIVTVHNKDTLLALRHYLNHCCFQSLPQQGQNTFLCRWWIVTKGVLENWEWRYSEFWSHIMDILFVLAAVYCDCTGWKGRCFWIGMVISQSDPSSGPNNPPSGVITFTAAQSANNNHVLWNWISLVLTWALTHSLTPWLFNRIHLDFKNPTMFLNSFKPSGMSRDSPVSGLQAESTRTQVFLETTFSKKDGIQTRVYEGFIVSVRNALINKPLSHGCLHTLNIRVLVSGGRMYTLVGILVTENTKTIRALVSFFLCLSF